MNTLLNTKHFLLLSACGMLFLASCSKDNAGENNETATEVAEEKNEAKFDGKAEDKAEFVVEVATMNLSEIKLNEMADQKSTNKDVKSFAKMMVEHHKAMGNDLTSLATKKNISVPQDMPYTEADNYKKLNDKSGLEFDKDFADIMVKEHENMIDKLESKRKDSKDEELNSFIDATLPKVRKHLDMATDLKNKVDAIKG